MNSMYHAPARSRRDLRRLAVHTSDVLLLSRSAVIASVFGHWPGTVSHVVFAGAVGYWVTCAQYGILAGRTESMIPMREHQEARPAA